MTEAEELRIERATAADTAGLAPIAEECGLSVDFAAELTKSYSVLLTAFLGQRLVGFLLAWRAADELHLTDLGVTAAARRRGVGRRLARTLAAIGTDGGSAVVLLEVRASNAAALALYTSLGFEQVSVRSRYYDSGEDAVVMRLYLGA